MFENLLLYFCITYCIIFNIPSFVVWYIGVQIAKEFPKNLKTKGFIVINYYWELRNKSFSYQGGC